MMDRNNKSETISFFDDILKYPFLCQACGMCYSVCKQFAIVFEQNEFSEFIPKLNQEKCISCKKCIDACPARKFKKKAPSVLGSYKRILIARSVNKDLNEKGSSGGVVTALAEFGIRNNYFHEILSTDYINSKIIAEPKYFKENIVSASGSKYVAAPLCTLYDKSKQKLAITALPCQAKAIKRQKSNSFVFGLFCSKLSNEDLIDYMKKKSMRNNPIKKVNYRKGLWPGKFSMTFENGKTISYKLNRSFFGAAYNSYIFSNSGCLLCDDYFAENADISFGDPWGNKQYQDGYLGETIIIVRTAKGDQLITKAIDEGIIIAMDTSVSKIIKGHIKEIYNKKTALKQRCEYANNKYEKKIQFLDTNFINNKTSKILNMYSIYNNWAIRTKGKYTFFKKVPFIFIFFTRFVHAFLLGQFIKNSNNFSDYLKIAQGEKID